MGGDQTTTVTRLEMPHAAQRGGGGESLVYGAGESKKLAPRREEAGRVCVCVGGGGYLSELHLSLGDVEDVAEAEADGVDSHPTVRLDVDFGEVVRILHPAPDTHTYRKPSWI